MTPLTAEWVEKAEGDFRAMRHLMDAAEPVLEAVGFHAQQCVEKYLKARLQEANIAFSKTHDLEALLELILPVERAWELMRAELAFLGRFAVESRYPGVVPAAEDAQDAVRICTDLRRTVRRGLGLGE